MKQYPLAKKIALGEPLTADERRQWDALDPGHSD
jgi:hypothetical protein